MIKDLHKSVCEICPSFVGMGGLNKLCAQIIEENFSN